MSVAVVTVTSMTVAVIPLRFIHEPLAAQRSRSPGGGGARSLHRTRIRRDDGRRDRPARRPDRADVLPPLRRQTRSAVRRPGRPAGTLRRQGRRRPAVDAPAGSGRRRPDGRRPVLRGPPQARTQAAGRDRGKSSAAGEGADQALGDRFGTRRGAGPQGRRRVGGEVDRRGWCCGVQGRIRAVDRRWQARSAATLHSRVARRTEGDGRRRLIMSIRKPAVLAVASLFAGAAAVAVPPALAAPATDGAGYVSSTARCEAPATVVVFGSTDTSRVAICRTSDGAFVADSGGIGYMVTAKSLVVSEGNKVIREEPMVEFHGPAAPAQQAATPTSTTPLPAPLP